MYFIRDSSTNRSRHLRQRPPRHPPDRQTYGDDHHSDRDIQVANKTVHSEPIVSKTTFPIAIFERPIPLGRMSEHYGFRILFLLAILGVNAFFAAAEVAL